MENFWCIWAPWLFAAISGLAGWFVRDWLSRDRIKSYENELSKKDNQFLLTSGKLEEEIKNNEVHTNRMVAEINSLTNSKEEISKSVITLRNELKSSKSAQPILIEKQNSDTFLEQATEDAMLGDILKYKKKLRRRKKRINRLKETILKLNTKNTFLKKK